MYHMRTWLVLWDTWHLQFSKIIHTENIWWCLIEKPTHVSWGLVHAVDFWGSYSSKSILQPKRHSRNMFSVKNFVKIFVFVHTFIKIEVWKFELHISMITCAIIVLYHLITNLVMRAFLGKDLQMCKCWRPILKYGFPCC